MFYESSKTYACTVFSQIIFHVGQKAFPKGFSKISDDFLVDKMKPYMKTITRRSFTSEYESNKLFLLLFIWKSTAVCLRIAHYSLSLQYKA